MKKKIESPKVKKLRKLFKLPPGRVAIELQMTPDEKAASVARRDIADANHRLTESTIAKVPIKFD